MKSKCLLLFALFFAISLSPLSAKQTKFDAYSQSKLAPSETLLKKQNSLQSNDISYPYSLKSNTLYIDLLAKVKSNKDISKLKTLGYQVNTHSNTTIVGLTVPVSKIDELENLDFIISLEVSKYLKKTLDQSKIAMDGSWVFCVGHGGLPGQVPGNDVIIGIIDSGIDVKHPDFNSSNGTKILSLWDMSDESGIDVPEVYGYGRIYSQSQIKNDINSVLETDTDGHGTHVASIAAGYGLANTDNDKNFSGVAFGSQLVIVKATRASSPDDFADQDLINALVYIMTYAANQKMPCVINMSIGSVFGSHDGTSLVSNAINELALMSDGTDNSCIFVVSAGNSGDMDIHSGGDVSANEQVEFLIQPENVSDIFGSDEGEPTKFLTVADVWASDSLFDGVKLSAYSQTETGLEIVKSWDFDFSETFDNMQLTNIDDTLALLDFFFNTSVQGNGDINILIKLHNGSNPSIAVNQYIWSISFIPKYDGDIHIWAGLPMPEDAGLSGNFGKQFYGDNYYTIEAPGDAEHVITVGSTVSKNNWTDMKDNPQSNDAIISSLSNFSSLGPRRDGMIKPTISAPGEMIFAAHSSDAYESDTTLLLNQYYIGLSGTSMAAPHVTGTIALILDLEPRTTYDQLITYFDKNSYRDEFTDIYGEEYPNIGVGYGKISAQRIIDWICDTYSVEESKELLKVYPNPAADYIDIQTENIIENPNIELFDIKGNQINILGNYNIYNNSEYSVVRLNTSNLTNGVYTVRIASDGHRRKYKFIVDKK